MLVQVRVVGRDPAGEGAGGQPVRAEPGGRGGAGGGGGGGAGGAGLLHHPARFQPAPASSGTDDHFFNQHRKFCRYVQATGFFYSDQDPGRIGIILADPDPYPFQPNVELLLILYSRNFQYTVQNIESCFNWVSGVGSESETMSPSTVQSMISSAFKRTQGYTGTSNLCTSIQLAR
jgi:hypothetical protein